MKMICAPSQVMREGRDLNQHGQAGRHEQPSSSSPVTFHDVLLAAAAARSGIPNALMPHTIATKTIDLLDMISFINFFSPIEMLPFPSATVIPPRGWSILKSTSRKRENSH